jgi:predicted aldo/keto reductase-like oxidoreductase
MTEKRKADVASQKAEHFWTDMVCKDCTRCVRACPASIDIPSLLIVEERIHAGEDEQVVKTDWQKKWKRKNTRFGQPIDCIECGLCNMRCPQGFHLLEIVRKYAMEQSGEYVGADLLATH